MDKIKNIDRKIDQQYQDFQRKIQEENIRLEVELQNDRLEYD